MDGGLKNVSIDISSRNSEKDSKGTPQDKLRLYVIFLLKSSGLSQADMDEFEEALRGATDCNVLSANDP